MRKLVSLAGVFIFLSLVLISPMRMRSAEIKSGPLAPDKNVPGSFHPFNVTVREIPPDELEDMDRDLREKDKEKYTPKNKFHCLVSEYDLDPVVLLFANGGALDASEGFQELLKDLDAAIIKNRGRRLRAFVVFLLDKEVDIVKDDDKREERAKEIRTLAEKLGLKRVVLTVTSSKYLPKYELDKDKALTAVLYRTLRIRYSHTFDRTDLDKADSPAVKTLLMEANKLIGK